MRIKLITSAALILMYAAASPAHAAADVVNYECTITATDEKQTVGLDIELTVPTDAEVGVEMTIGWRGSYVAGAELHAPAAGVEGDLNIYAYAGISGYPGLTSATGVAPAGLILPGQPIALPETIVELKTTADAADSGTVHAGAVNFGLTPQDPLIECEVLNSGTLTEYPLTVPGTGETPSPTPTPEPTEEPTEDPTEDPTEETTEPETTTTTTRTPEGGAATGGGGTAGPDGRALVATGLLVILAAAAGLGFRRPRRAS
ncbi:hypothetical protein ITP53_38840 [Nonomuraea sp. K274]|uniref:Uncharacterized protein n=1 Tax=Nonomuraea cypriaca TaxID=1187855 RepID=A0A931F158_9ACTN|nr:hypothetical protein [Nonomuraea cypriaca]MBF8191554.1 hypothetical protein [Nonomuraea cypriaca]